MNEESGGFGSGAVQMKALPATSATVKIEERNGNTGEKLTSCKFLINKSFKKPNQSRRRRPSVFHSNYNCPFLFLHQGLDSHKFWVVQGFGFSDTFHAIT